MKQLFQEIEELKIQRVFSKYEQLYIENRAENKEGKRYMHHIRPDLTPFLFQRHYIPREREQSFWHIEKKDKYLSNIIITGLNWCNCMDFKKNKSCKHVKKSKENWYLSNQLSIHILGNKDLHKIFYKFIN